MYDWRINVARDRYYGSAGANQGKAHFSHYFRVELGDGHYDEADARERYEALRAAFPEPEYQISLARITRPVGTYLEGGPK